MEALKVVEVPPVADGKSSIAAEIKPSGQFTVWDYDGSCDLHAWKLPGRQAMQRAARRTLTSIWMAFLAAAAGLGVGAAMTNALTLRYNPNTKMVCSANGCQAVDPKTAYSLVDTDAKTYSRCDAKGCDTYPAEMAASGQFGNVEVPGRSMLHQFDFSNGAYVEIATQLLDAFISYGTCNEVNVTPWRPLLTWQGG